MFNLNRYKDDSKRFLIEAVCFTIFLVLNLTWSFSIPLGSVPDEGQQMVYSAAIVRGEFLSHSIASYYKQYSPDNEKNIAETVPSYFLWLYYQLGGTIAWVAKGATTPYFQLSKKITAFGKKDAIIGTYIGRYPPLYYLLTGLPTLITSYRLALYLMRVFSAFFSALFITIGFHSLKTLKNSKIVLIGFLLALVPNVFIYSAIVDASGLEIALGLCAWATGITWAVKNDQVINKSFRKFLIVLSIYSIVRPISPIWAFATLLFCFMLAGKEKVLQSVKEKVNLIYVGVFLFCCLFTLLWIHIRGNLIYTTPLQLRLSPQGFTNYYQKPFIQEVFFSLYDSGYLIGQMIAQLIINPFKTMIIEYAWEITLGLILLLAVGLTQKKAAVLSIGFFIFLLVSYAIGEAKYGHELGLWWQGRYSCPIAVGVPILTFAALQKYPSNKLKAIVDYINSNNIPLIFASVLVLIGNFSTYFFEIHIYATGSKGGYLPPFHKINWPVPAGLYTWMSLYLIAWLALIVLIANAGKAIQSHTISDPNYAQITSSAH